MAAANLYLGPRAVKTSMRMIAGNTSLSIVEGGTVPTNAESSAAMAARSQGGEKRPIRFEGEGLRVNEGPALMLDGLFIGNGDELERYHPSWHLPDK